MLVTRRVSVCLALAAATPAGAQLANLDEQLRTTPITTQQLAENLYVLFGVGGNILVSIGANGVLIVDDQFPQMVPKYKATIGELGGGAVNFAINTHWHFDHADGNQVLGPEGTWFVAHENSRAMMGKNNVINLVTQQRDQPAYPETAWPVLTYDDTMRFHFNGERIDLMHFGPAHTTGDTAVIFRGHKVVHMGDVFSNAGYPFIDVDNGGSLNGVIEFTTKVLEQIDADYMVVPGHGPVANAQALTDYVAMLTTIRDRMNALIASGATLKQVIATQPTSEWDERKGEPASFLDRSYLSLTRERKVTPSFVNEGVVEAPIAEVWKVLSTSEGYRVLGPALAEVDLRVGGTIRSRYRADGVLGDAETIENVILAYEPPTMMATRIQKPPASFPFKEAWKNPWTVMTLVPLDGGRTLMRAASLGYGSDEESLAMRRFFEAGNQQTIENIQHHFARPAAPQ